MLHKNFSTVNEKTVLELAGTPFLELGEPGAPK